MPSSPFARAFYSRLRAGQQVEPRALVTMSANRDTAYLDIGSEVVSDDVREVFGFGVSGGAVRDALRGLDGLGVQRLEVQINSPGGDVFAGQAIYENILDFKRKSGAQVDVRVYGLAASIASIIMLAGDERIMGAGSFVMIHNPWSVAIGDSVEMRKTADLLDKVGGSLVEMYDAATALTRDEIVAMMDAETWLTPQESIEAGFATGTTADIDGASAAAKYAGYASAFRKMPDSIANNEREKGRAKVEAELARMRLSAMQVSML
jgi:ATP-dependent Clp protease, protease subunit